VRRGVRQVFDLSGDHGKAAAIFSCLDRLNGGIDCQNIGLIGDVVHRTDNGVNLNHRLPQVIQLVMVLMGWVSMEGGVKRIGFILSW
jgi:hypothetical protein